MGSQEKPPIGAVGLTRLGFAHHVSRAERGQDLGIERRRDAHRSAPAQAPEGTRHRRARELVRECRICGVHRHHVHCLVGRDARQDVSDQRIAEFVRHVHAPPRRRPVLGECLGKPLRLLARHRLERRAVALAAPQTGARHGARQSDRGQRPGRDRGHAAREAEQDPPRVDELRRDIRRRGLSVSEQHGVARAHRVDPTIAWASEIGGSVT